MSARTGYVFHPDCIEHDTGPGHPERSDRLRAIQERLRGSGLSSELDPHEPREATVAALVRVHSEEHERRMARTAEAAPGPIDGETTTCPASYRAARLAAGAVLEAVERVHARSWSNAFCAVRPPGHHAEEDQAMGFCLFNNVAVAAAHLRATHGIERVAILDWDVHHGNGTQHLFEHDPSVFYASLHQWPLYPGTGAASERGLGPGEGSTRNCPLEARSGDAQWLAALEQEILPELDLFRPQFVLISAGFDAHRLDPLAQVELTELGYGELTRRMLELADRHAGGRLVSVLEGGYSLEGLAGSVEAHLGVLCGGDR